MLNSSLQVTSHHFCRHCYSSSQFTSIAFRPCHPHKTKTPHIPSLTLEHGPSHRRLLFRKLPTTSRSNHIQISILYRHRVVQQSWLHIIHRLLRRRHQFMQLVRYNSRTWLRLSEQMLGVNARNLVGVRRLLDDELGERSGYRSFSGGEILRCRVDVVLIANFAVRMNLLVVLLDWCLRRKDPRTTNFICLRLEFANSTSFLLFRRKLKSHCLTAWAFVPLRILSIRFPQVITRMLRFDDQIGSSAYEAPELSSIVSPSALPLPFPVH
jgi:hypothetical protein